MYRFGDKGWREVLRQKAQDFKFHATLPVKLDQAEADWVKSQPTAENPVVVHDPVDDELQPGDSCLLGGGMSIHAPWSDQD